MDVSSKGFSVESYLVGERIELRGLELWERLASDPLAFRLGAGLAVLFRYGVVTFFDVPTPKIAEFLDRLKEHVVHPLSEPETERILVQVDSEARETMVGNTLFLHDRSVERCQVVADVLSKSVALSIHESSVGESFQSCLSRSPTNSNRPAVQDAGPVSYCVTLGGAFSVSCESWGASRLPTSRN